MFERDALVCSGPDDDFDGVTNQFNCISAYGKPKKLPLLTRRWKISCETCPREAGLPIRRRHSGLWQSKLT